ncbi:MAG: hypothetical protein HQK51_12230 [Oligoflexia bacterium]|nr:hypothetical protein [Oligoflexia bacterium]
MCIRFSKFIFYCYLVVTIQDIYAASVSIPKVDNQELQQQINRISPNLLWCDGQATGTDSNNVDHRPNCDVGDAASESGHFTLVGQFSNEEGIFNAMRNSFGLDDQPFRAPSYVGKDSSNEFSRDQTLGFIEATVAGLPYSEGLERIERYYNRNGSLCPNASDNRCVLTPSMWIYFKDLSGRNVTQLERFLDEQMLNLEASENPLNYRSYLVSRQVFLKAMMGKLTSSYAQAMKTLYKRAPKNLWFRTVYHVTNGGTNTDFENVAKSLVECMKTWNQPGTTFLWSEGNVECTQGLYGHELVSLGHFLLGKSRANSEVVIDTTTIITILNLILN